jgi:hypothetical protein
MSQQLLLTACEQAERSETAVRAAALMPLWVPLRHSDKVHDCAWKPHSRAIP